jgi:hypothetical protein
MSVRKLVLEVTLADLRRLKKAYALALWHVQDAKDARAVRAAVKLLERLESDTVLSPEITYVEDWSPVMLLVNTPIKSKRRRGKGARGKTRGRLYKFAPVMMEDV